MAGLKTTLAMARSVCQLAAVGGSSQNGLSNADITLCQLIFQFDARTSFFKGWQNHVNEEACARSFTMPIPRLFPELPARSCESQDSGAIDHHDKNGNTLRQCTGEWGEDTSGGERDQAH